MSQIGDKIIEILSEKDKLKMDDIKIKLKEFGPSVSSPILNKNLTRMMEEGKIIREEEGDPWYYVYKLNKKPLEK